MSKDPNDRYRRPLDAMEAHERFHAPGVMYTDDDGIDYPCDENGVPDFDHPVTVAVDPAAPDSDYSELVMVDNTDGKLLINPVLTLQPQPINLTFSDDNGKQIGEFRWNKDRKTWEFEGNADDSAKVFAKFMAAHFQSIINGDRDGILDAAITDMYGGKGGEEPEPEKVWPEHTPMPGNHPDWMKVHVSGKFKD